jgi:hypothetical protein
MGTEKYVPLPATTKAFICANCGAVSLSEEGICKVQGMGTKADWCGTKSLTPPKLCFNRVHNLRFVCKKCGKVAVNPELLCEPERMVDP